MTAKWLDIDLMATVRCLLKDPTKFRLKQCPASIKSLFDVVLLSTNFVVQSPESFSETLQTFDDALAPERGQICENHENHENYENSEN